jgi:hypothetical protein
VEALAALATAYRAFAVTHPTCTAS